VNSWKAFLRSDLANCTHHSYKPVNKQANDREQSHQRLVQTEANGKLFNAKGGCELTFVQICGPVQKLEIVHPVICCQVCATMSSVWKKSNSSNLQLKKACALVKVINLNINE